MIKTFTQADLIRYLYHETTEKEEQEINKALLCDSDLRDQYKKMRSMKHDIESAQLEPSPDTIRNILNYSKSTSSVKH